MRANRPAEIVPPLVMDDRVIGAAKYQQRESIGEVGNGGGRRIGDNHIRPRLGVSRDA